jgi:pimeloyl-ACP methyl ester carboxylesterase
MATMHDLQLPDGRRLVVHDSGDGGRSDRLILVWHHGSPQTGALLDPLVVAAAARDIRLVSYGRPSYGGSSPNRGRDVASAAGDVAAVVDAASHRSLRDDGLGRRPFLRSPARHGSRIPADQRRDAREPGPYTEAFDWFAGMVAGYRRPR